jgi:hypothetical protein
MVGGALLNHIDQYDFSLTIIHASVFGDLVVDDNIHQGRCRSEFK